MRNNLSSLDKRVIQTLLRKKSFADIADIIDKPLLFVQDYILEYLEGKNIETYQQKLTNKILGKKKKQQQEKSNKSREDDLKKHKKKTILAQEHEMQNNRRRRNEPVFATKQTDYSQKKLIRIDARTSVYVDPNTDVAEFRRNYIERMNKPKPEPEKKYKEVKKFKPL